VARGSTVVLTISRGADTVSVPALTGLTLQDALQKLQAAGLKASADRVASKKPEGQIVAQVPGGSAELKKGATVKLSVSKGVERVDVPDVVGQPSDAATTALTQAGLQAAPRQVPSGQPEGTVVAQSPKAGERAAKGSKVQINVSGGRAATGSTTTTGTTTTQAATVTVPDLVGSTFADARRQLGGLGLKADRKDVPSTEPFGNVVAQFPAAGGTAKRGGSVRVNVSKGPPSAAIPDVIGDDQDTATQKLRNAGFTVKVETQDTEDATEDGVVLDQAPAAGETRKRGASVTITVGALTGG
jgi:serine/threonine-protein kinase